MNIYSDQAEFSFQTALEEGKRDTWHDAVLRRPNKLLSFSAVKKMLNLELPQDRGIQEIEIDDVVGSIGRYNEFNRKFKPVHGYTRGRWKTVAESYYQKGFAPISVYKVSNIYFVVDGNHRVSISRAMKLQTITAQVFEFETLLELDKSDDLKSICHKSQSLQPMAEPFQLRKGQITNIGPAKWQQSQASLMVRGLINGLRSAFNNFVGNQVVPVQPCFSI